jgi:hypothetical protein
MNMKNSSSRFSIFPLTLILCIILSCGQQGEKVDVEKKAEADLKLDKIPQVVMNALKAKFPNAEIHKWTKEKEGDIVVYDIEFKQQNQKFEADIKEDGSIHNWEKEITAEDLPVAAMKTVETKYSQSTIKEIMEITAVTEGKDALEGYEIVLETPNKKDVEIMVAPNGKILEDSEEAE